MGGEGKSNSEKVVKGGAWGGGRVGRVGLEVAEEGGEGGAMRVG